ASHRVSGKRMGADEWISKTNHSLAPIRLLLLGEYALIVRLQPELVLAASRLPPIASTRSYALRTAQRHQPHRGQTRHRRPHRRPQTAGPGAVGATGRPSGRPAPRG